MQTLSNMLIKIVLSDTEKRILVIIFLVFLLFIFILGLLNKIHKKLMVKRGLEIDKHINGYYKFGFVKTEKEFKALAKKKNNLLLLKQLTIPLIILAISFIFIGIYCGVTNQNLSYVFSIYGDMLLKLDWHMTTVLGIPLPSQFPTISEDSFIFHGDANGIFAYIFLILFLTGIILYFNSLLKYIARQKRISQKMKSIFEVKLEDEVKPEI